MLNYMDRSALSITAPLIEKELGFSPAEMGMIFSAFFVGYALFNFIGGWASDKVGPKTVFLVCSLTVVHFLWHDWFIRVLFGMAEGPVSSAGNKIISSWISRKQSATAIGIFSAGSPLGGALSGPVVGLLALSLGWRPAFAWAIIWYFVASDKPSKSKLLAPSEPITIFLFFFLTWFPSYLNHSLHLNIKEISIATIIPWVIGSIGMILGGVCSDFIYRITGAAICVAISGSVTTIESAIALMSYLLAVIQDVVHKDKVGSVGGAMHGLANTSGIIGPFVTGLIVQFSETDVLIKVDAAGICGSDIGAFRGTNPLVTYPRNIGHEVSGIVLEKGTGMPENIKEGDRVVIDPYIYCGHCYPCSIGRTNCCESLKVIGVHVDGAMQEVVTHPAHLIHKVPEELSQKMHLLQSHWTIALHALHRTKLKAGEYVVIIGAGAIGLLAALSALHYNAIPILVDLVEERLAYAKTLGVIYTINPLKTQVIEQVKEITAGSLAQVVVEASGANSAIRQTLDLASFAGRIAFTGWPKQETPLPTNLITFKELDLCGSRTSVGEFAEALEILTKRNINPEDIISKFVSLDDVPALVREQEQYPERYLKINTTFK
ncbi:unnamed protein product [Ranitomeya imitator]|uniref:Alcohol dehydrogenase n=1 Tax=Ranitomeya imitator TaxID=111125 RepID=A0ABN9LVQ2_9NEOB|nr:unnamed protein product [Ranitomeya imitator]